MQINRKFLAFCRTIHIYLTMLGLIVMFFFGVTGFTVNHEDWFGATTPRAADSVGSTEMALIEKHDALHIVEHLRNTHHITAAMTSYDELEDTISIGFKSPDQIWEVEIAKADGKTAVHHETFNTIALINNLHRGRYSGAAWRWIIDITALLIAVACVTGVILWLVLPKRRKLGIAALAGGALIAMGVYWMLVPGGDINNIKDSKAAQSGVEEAQNAAPAGELKTANSIQH